MILYNIVKEQIEARQKRRIAKAKAEGEEKGCAEGFQIANQEWIDWFERKEAAEAAGEPFDEPSPAEKHHTKNQ